MDLLKMIAELREERARIEEAIIPLERMARGQGKRRGHEQPGGNHTVKRGFNRSDGQECPSTSFS